MPTSTFVEIQALASYFSHAKPRTILDVGIGFGKNGFIVRECLDVMESEKHRKEDWGTRLDGIEVFEDYIQEHQKFLYDNIYIGDAYDVIDGLGQYDLIVIGDSLEHFDKDRAWEMLDKCAEHCNRYIVISIPIGERWVQDAVHDNEYERHRSFWTKEELEPFSCAKKYFTFGKSMDYGRFLIHKDDYKHYRLRIKAEARVDAGEIDQAMTLLARGLTDLPPHFESEALFVELLFRSGKYPEATHRLQEMQKQFPEASEMVNELLGQFEEIMTQPAG